MPQISVRSGTASLPEADKRAPHPGCHNRETDKYGVAPRNRSQAEDRAGQDRQIRQYFPRTTNFSQVSQAQLDSVALRLNQRPRKTLDFETPADRLQKALQ
jgi:hypothetical protein